MFSITWTPILQTFVWLLLLDLGRGGSISAWHTGVGAPQLAMYDNSTGKIFYSLCNSNSTPVFPANETAAFQLEIPPQSDTSIAGTGYRTEGHNVAAIHYIAEKGGIVQAIFHCDDTGHYISDPNQAWIVSNGANADLPEDGTALAALVLGENGGYRIYYRTPPGMVTVLQSTQISTTGEGHWSYGYLVEQQSTLGPSIQAGFVNSDRITVATSLSINASILVSTSQEHDWLIESFPYGVSIMEEDELFDRRPTNNTDYLAVRYPDNQGQPMEAYARGETHIGLAFGTNDARYTFYIGNDSSIHQFVSSQSVGDIYDESWTLSDPPPNSTLAWPRADTPNADFAVAWDSDLDKIWLYYVVNGSMTQVHQSSLGVWEPPVALPKFNATAAVAGADPRPDEPSEPEPEPEAGDSGGLSGSGKTGVGVGVGLGLPILGAFAAYALWYVRRSRRHPEADLAAVGAGAGYGADGQWVQPQPQPQQQMYAAAGAKPYGQWQQVDPRFTQMYVGGGSPPPPVHEMAHPEPAYEVAGDGQVSEMPGSQQQESAPTLAPVSATDTAPASIPSPPEQQRAVSPMLDAKGPPK